MRQVPPEPTGFSLDIHMQGSAPSVALSHAVLTHTVSRMLFLGWAPLLLPFRLSFSLRLGFDLGRALPASFAIFHPHMP